MTRPRICSPAASCTVALAAVVKVRTAAPVGSSRSMNSTLLGISPATASATPNMMAAASSSRNETCLRRVASTAPNREPTASVEVKAP